MEKEFVIEELGNETKEKEEKGEMTEEIRMDYAHRLGFLGDVLIPNCPRGLGGFGGSSITECPTNFWEDLS